MKEKAKIEKLITEYQNKIDIIDKWKKGKDDFFRELRFKLSRPHTTCYSPEDYDNMRDDYFNDRSLNFARRQCYIQVIEDLKELL